MKASVVVKDARIPELEKAIREQNLQNKKIKKDDDYSDDDWLDPQNQELKKEVRVLNSVLI